MKFEYIIPLANLVHQIVIKKKSYLSLCVFFLVFVSTSSNEMSIYYPTNYSSTSDAQKIIIIIIIQSRAKHDVFFWYFRMDSRRRISF